MNILFSSPDTRLAGILAERLADLGEHQEFVVVGGHHDWPAVPTRHAEKSIRVGRSLATLKAGTLVAFLDDIGAGAACGGPVCDPIRAKGVEAMPAVAFEGWCRQYLRSVAQALADGQPVPPEAVALLGAHLQSGAGAGGAMAWHGQGALERDAGEWLQSLEVIIHQHARSDFIPLRLALISGIVPQVTIFERTMNNAASRNLHKIARKRIPTRMRIEKSGDVTEFVIDAPGVGRPPILLRREVNTEHGMQSANRCSALLAMLFHTLVRDSVRVRPDLETLIITYIIPCYDRGRLRDGIHAFFELFPDLGALSRLKRLSLVSVAFSGSPIVPMVCDWGVLDAEASQARFGTFHAKGIGHAKGRGVW